MPAPVKRVNGTSPSGMDAAALLASPSASTEDIESALESVLRDGTTAEFEKAFGPRRLMKLLSCGALSERAAELADTLLSGGPVSGLTPELTFGDVLHRDELLPDELVSLASPPPPPITTSDNDWPLHLPIGDDGSGRAAFVRSSGGQLRFEPSSDNGDSDEPAPTLKIVQLSRRQRIGSEIECKVWPAAAILSRWLWRHKPLIRGQTILELGAGVGTAGLAAAASGARKVVITDINESALRCARQNCERNGEVVQRSAVAAHLDWARPPILEPASNGVDAEEEDEVDGLLRQQFDVLLAADIINNLGLSEMVMEMVKLYLKPKGLFIMVCPKAKHRYCIEQLREMLIQCEALSVEVEEVEGGGWLTEGVDLECVSYELLLAQWRRT